MITPGTALEALRGHLRRKALEALARHGVPRGRPAIERILADRAAVRHPLEIAFGADGLGPGEFAWLEPSGPRPADGFRLHVHPLLAAADELLPAAVAYYIPSVNYGAVVGPAEAETYGAALCAIEPDRYHATLCEIAHRVDGKATP